ncbi:MAG: polysaccharide biosynthesis protein, partial [Phycisphaeraceae bacterium]
MSILSSILGKAEPRLKLQRPTGELVDVVPGARTLLIGTARTLKQMRHTLREADEPMRLIGGLVWQPQHHAGAMGLPVLGTAEQLEMVAKVHEIERVLISLPAAMGAATSRLLARCREIGVTARVLPTIEDQLTGRVNGGRGSLDYNALLDRPARKLDRDTIRQLLAGKRVMIAGAGGSIGSELARIIASYGPSHLLLRERAE